MSHYRASIRNLNFITSQILSWSMSKGFRRNFVNSAQISSSNFKPCWGLRSGKGPVIDSPSNNNIGTLDVA